MTRRCLLSFFTLALTLTLTHAADWPRFRGPNGTGVAEGPLPEIDPAKPLWKTRIPGKGNSSPIVVGGKVYLQSASADGKTRTLVCLNAATGKIDWTKDVPGVPARTHAKNSMASGTPACDGERIYCQWWDGSGVSLHAYDLTGKELWRESLGGYKSQHGPGFSPMLHDGLVFVNVDDDQRAELVAFDARTGEKKWVAERKHERASYSTPFLFERPGKPAELILGTTTALTSYDPKTGKVNWDYPIPWKGQMALRVVGSPIYAAGVFVLYTGDGGGARYMIAVNPDGKRPTKAWDLKRDTPYVPCVLAKGDRLYWISDNKRGIATCTDAKTGKVIWSGEVYPDAVTASPILVGDEILMVSEKGEVAVMKAGDKFDEPEKLPLRERVYASPAFADGKVYIRGESHLFCFGKK